MVCRVKVDATIPVMLSQEVFDDWDFWIFQVTHRAGALASVARLESSSTHAQTAPACSWVGPGKGGRAKTC